MAASKTLRQEILDTLRRCPEGLSRDSLYRSGALSAHSEAALLLALQDLVADGSIAPLMPGEFGTPYRLTARGREMAPGVVFAHTDFGVAREAEQEVARRGSPIARFDLVAELWNAMPVKRFTPERVALFMGLFKLAAEELEPAREHRVDLAGYAEVLDQIHREREPRSETKTPELVAV